MSYKLLAQGQWWNVNKQIAIVVGIEAALLLSDLIGKYLYHKENEETVLRDDVQYFFYTSEDIEEQTTLSYTLQKKNIKILEERGFIKTCLMGIPAKLHFNIDENKISEFLKTGVEKNSKLYIKNKHTKNKYKNIYSFSEKINEDDSLLPTQTHTELPSKEKEDAYPFEEFWNDYDKKVGDKEKIKTKWAKISAKDKTKIKEYIPRYIRSQPQKKYRKNPETFLNNKSWNDEIIVETLKKGNIEHEPIKKTPVSYI